MKRTDQISNNQRIGHKRVRKTSLLLVNEKEYLIMFLKTMSIRLEISHRFLEYKDIKREKVH